VTKKDKRGESFFARPMTGTEAGPTKNGRGAGATDHGRMVGATHVVALLFGASITGRHHASSVAPTHVFGEPVFNPWQYSIPERCFGCAYSGLIFSCEFT
jgi:hypothetical protein